MSNSCTEPFSIAVSDPLCSLLTPTDWLNGTVGACRLRVRNFNAADWLAGGCGACANAGGLTWDGTFPNITHLGGEIQYGIDPATGNIGGKAPFFGQNCAVGTLAGSWYVALSCNPQFIWSSDFHPVAGGPLITFNRNQGCVLLANLVIEAYTP